jgi:hypothetical protein
LADNDKTKVSDFKWGSEIICHFCLNGGNSKYFGTDDSEEEFDEEERNCQSEETNEEEETIEK